MTFLPCPEDLRPHPFGVEVEAVFRRGTEGVRVVGLSTAPVPVIISQKYYILYSSSVCSLDNAG